MAEKNSLWKNIRKKAEQNRRTGAKPKKPTAEMLRQEKKIKAKKYAEGGETDPPYRSLGIPMEGYEPDSVFYETPTRYSEPVNKKEDKPKPTSKRSEVQDYYLNQYLNQNSSTPKLDKYVAEKDTSSTKLSPAMSTKESFEGELRQDNPIWDQIKYGVDLASLSGYYPANVVGSIMDAVEGDYTGAAIGLVPIVGKAGKHGRLWSQAYTKLRNSGVSEPAAQAIKKYGKKTSIIGSYGVNAADVKSDLIDKHSKGGYMYPDGGKTKVYTDPKEFKKAERAYNDSLSAYKAGKDFFDDFSNSSNTFKRVTPNQYHIEAAKDIFNTNINPSEIYEDPNSAADIFIPLWKKPEIKPVLEKPTVDKLQSKQYSNFSSNKQPSIVGNVENISPSEINMDKFYEGQYEKYRRSPYEDPMYRVWVPGQQMQIVPEEQFKKLNDQYALKNLEQKAQGGYMYDGGGPTTLYKKAEYDPNTGKILEYAGSQDNKYYVTPNTPQGIDFERRLPEIEIIENTGLYDPNAVGPTAPKFIPSETGPTLNPNWRSGDALEYVPIESALLPASLPFKATTRLGKAALFGAELANPLGGFRNFSVKNKVGEVKNQLSKAVKGTSSVLGEIKGELLQGKLNRESIKKGNEWLENWIKHPATKEKINTTIDNKIDFAKQFYSDPIEEVDLLNLIRTQSRDFKPNSKEYSLLKQLDNNLQQYLSKKSRKSIHQGNWGVSYQHQYSPKERLNIEMGIEKPLSDRYGSWISRTTKLPQKSRVSTTIHEGTHDWISEEAFKKSGMRNIALQNMDPKIKNDFLDWESYRELGIDPAENMGKERAYQAYLADPTEQHARIMELRHNLDITPDYKMNEEIAKGIIDWIDKGRSSIDPKFLNVINKDPKKLTELFNKFWMAPPAIIGVGAMQDSETEKQAQGGYINPYMYYAGGPMYYGDGGKIWKHIGAGAYGILEGGLDTLTFGATDKLTDKGFDWLTKVGNKNLDLNDPKNAKFLRTQQQIRGYSNVAGAIGTAAFTGQWGSAIGQSAKGVNTAFQATEGLSDDFKKWSNIGSQAIGIGAGLAGGSLNVESASKAGQAAANFGSQVSKYAPYANQGLGMIGGNQQSLLEQAEARQDYLNSPEYLAMKERENQAYVNQGLSFASTGGNINNSLNLQNSMRGKYNNYKRRYSKGGTFQKFGINEIPDSAGYHHENAYGGVPIGPNAMAEGGEFVLDNNYVVSDEVDGMNTQTDEFGRTMAQNLKRDLSKYTMRDLDSKHKDSPRRPMDPLPQETINQIKQKAMMETEMARAEAQAKEQERQAMVDGALQYAAAGGKLNDDITKIVKEEYAAAYGGYINPKKYKGLNMPYSSGGKLPKEVLRARVESHMSPEQADAYVENYAKGGGIHIKESKKGTFTAAAKKRGKSVQEFARQVLANKGNYSAAMVKKANFARNAAGWKHAQGGPVVSNVNQDFDLYAQNRGGMMMAQGGNFPGIDNDPLLKYENLYDQRMEDLMKFTPDISDLGNDIIDPVDSIQSTIPGYDIQRKNFQNPLNSNITTPGIVGNVESMPLSKDATYLSPFQRYLSNNYPEGLNKLNFLEAKDEEGNMFEYGTSFKPVTNNQSAAPDSTTPWYEEPLYSKAARYGQAIPGVIASITALQNKKRKLPYRKLDAQTVNYEPERIIDREESRRRFNTFADRMKNIASNAGMLAGNLRGTLLGSNKELAGRIAESVMREKNTNAQLAQQTAMTQFGADRETDAFNEQMFQNAQTQAIAGLQDTTGKLAGAAGEERKQYLQEWIAKNKLKTRDFIQGPDGSYYYEGPDGTLIKV